MLQRARGRLSADLSQEIPEQLGDTASVRCNISSCVSTVKSIFHTGCAFSNAVRSIAAVNNHVSYFNEPFNTRMVPYKATGMLSVHMWLVP